MEIPKDIQEIYDFFSSFRKGMGANEKLEAIKIGKALKARYGNLQAHVGNWSARVVNSPDYKNDWVEPTPKYNPVTKKKVAPLSEAGATNEEYNAYQEIFNQALTEAGHAEVDSSGAEGQERWAERERWIDNYKAKNPSPVKAPIQRPIRPGVISYPQQPIQTLKPSLGLPRPPQPQRRIRPGVISYPQQPIQTLKPGIVGAGRRPPLRPVPPLQTLAQQKLGTDRANKIFESPAPKKQTSPHYYTGGWQNYQGDLDKAMSPTGGRDGSTSPGMSLEAATNMLGENILR